jgi:hypothetical protein
MASSWHATEMSFTGTTVVDRTKVVAFRVEQEGEQWAASLELVSGTRVPVTPNQCDPNLKWDNYHAPMSAILNLLKIKGYSIGYNLPESLNPIQSPSPEPKSSEPTQQ